DDEIKEQKQYLMIEIQKNDENEESINALKNIITNVTIVDNDDKDPLILTSDLEIANSQPLIQTSSTAIGHPFISQLLIERAEIDLLPILTLMRYSLNVYNSFYSTKKSVALRLKPEIQQAKLKEARNAALNELYQQLAKTTLVGLIPPPPQVVIRRPVASVGLRAWDRLALWVLSRFILFLFY
ncbi:MAG: hypothetical protein EZS28_055605, partial [Streblomastix strix]